MIERFVRSISKSDLFEKKDKILLAISGGIDSVLMLHMFSKAGMKCGIVHCNFQLRGPDSDTDEMFVMALAKKYNCKVYIERFDTAGYAEKNKVSIQMAARDLRYSFFERIRRKYKYKFIATAHHATDNVETVLINMLRGSGLNALTGIKRRNKFIVRPLLPFTRVEIEDAATESKLNWREDRSNESDDYLRNKIRHHILPVLKEINPSLEQTFLKQSELIGDAYTLLQKHVAGVKKRTIRQSDGGIIIDLKKLKEEKEPEWTWFELLREFNFNSDVVRQLYKSKKLSGGQFFSHSHRLVVDRNRMIIIANDHLTKQLYNIAGTGTFAIGRDKLKVTKVKYTKKAQALILKNKKKHVAFLDAAAVQFPLTVRNTVKGDYFYPLGMKGKKLLSDFYIDKKYSLIQKEKQLLLLANNKIAWVIGERISEQFKTAPETKHFYKFQFSFNE